MKWFALVGITLCFGVALLAGQSEKRARQKKGHTASLRPAQKRAAIKKWLLPKGFQYPNGLAYGPDGSLFIGSVTEGKILRRRPDGHVEIFFQGHPEVFAGTALRIDTRRGWLWGTSPDFLGTRGADGVLRRRAHRIFAISLRDGRLQRVLRLPNKGFGNDLAISKKGEVYVTDSSLGCVWRVGPQAKTLHLWAKDKRFRQGKLGPAGIALLPSGDLLIGLFSVGQFYQIAKDSKRVKRVFKDVPVKNLDGIRVRPDGQILALDAHLGGVGRLLLLKRGAKTRVKVLASGLKDPVNLTLVPGTNELWVSECNIHHRLNPKTIAQVPARFSLRHIRLQSPPRKKPTSPKKTASPLPPNFFPESMAMGADGSIYVGSATLSNILVIRPEQPQKTWIYGAKVGLISVQGLLVDEPRHRLYACTGDLGVAQAKGKASALFAFDLRNASLVGKWTLPKGGFCNDMVADGKGGLLISDTRMPRILRFAPNKAKPLQTWHSHPSLGGKAFNGNGIARDPQTHAVYLNTFADGRLLRIEVDAKGKPTRTLAISLPRPLDGADAMRSMGPGRLLVFENGLSKGKGQLTEISITGRKARLRTLLRLHTQPTSGVFTGESIFYLNSQFAHLFGAKKGRPAPLPSIGQQTRPF